MQRIDISHLVRTGEVKQMEIPTCNFSEFIVAASEWFRETNQRMGQAYFNACHVLRPDISEEIRGSDIDAFYDNNKLPAMLAEIYSRW